MARKSKPHKAKKEKPPAPSGEDKKGKKPGIEVTEIPGQVSLERSPFKLRGKIKYLSTGIDNLHKFVLDKKVVPLRDAAKQFRVDSKIAEDWGRILEDHNMIEMHYPITGEPTMRVPGYGKRRKKKGEKEEPSSKDKKPEKKAKKKHGRRLTKKRLMIMAELIVLSEVLIYIFLVNPHLRDNFVPTLNYQLTNLPANLTNLLSSTGLPITLPMLAGIALVVVLVVIFAVIRKRKKGRFSRVGKHKEEHKKKEETSKEKEEKKSEKPKKPSKPEKEEKKAAPSKAEKPSKAEAREDKKGKEAPSTKDRQAGEKEQESKPIPLGGNIS